MPISAAPSRLLLALGLVLTANSCEFLQGPAHKPTPAAILEARAAYRWWDHPDAIEENLLAVGLAGAGSHMGMSRNAAMIDARSKLRASLKTFVLELVETWLESTDPSEDLPGLRRVVNATSFTDMITASVSRTAPVVQQHEEGSKVYSLVAVQSPGAFLDELGSQLIEQVIQPDTFFRDEEVKAAVTADLVDLIKSEKARIAESRAVFEAGPIETESPPKQGKR